MATLNPAKLAKKIKQERYKIQKCFRIANPMTVLILVL